MTYTLEISGPSPGLHEQRRFIGSVWFEVPLAACGRQLISIRLFDSWTSFLLSRITRLYKDNDFTMSQIPLGAIVRYKLTYITVYSSSMLNNTTNLLTVSLVDPGHIAKQVWQ